MAFHFVKQLLILVNIIKFLPAQTFVKIISMSSFDLNNPDRPKRNQQWQHVALSHFDLTATDPALDEFGDLIDLWRSRRQGGTVPPRSAFKFQDLRGWHDLVALSDYDSAFEAPRYRIFPEAHARIFGREMTGKSLTEILGAETVKRLKGYLEGVRDLPAIGLFKGYFVAQPRNAKDIVTALHLPLTSGADEKVNMLMHVIAPSCAQR